jgi:hypothetical protein
VGGFGGTATAGYDAVYFLEIFLLFVTLISLGPLVRRRRAPAFTLTSPLQS